MRINIFTTELSDIIEVTKLVDEERNTSTVAINLILANDPLASLSFYLPNSKDHREQFALTLEKIAKLARNAVTEDAIEEKARALAKAAWEEHDVVGLTSSALSRDNYVDKSWYDFTAKAIEELNAPPKENIVKDPRIELLQYLIGGLTEKSPTDSMTIKEIYTWLTNSIYLILTGSREEKFKQMNDLNLPKLNED